MATLVDLHPSFQPNVNFDRLKDVGDVAGAVIKASEGTSVATGGHRDYQRRAREQGLRTGFYHFLRPKAGRKGRDEADFFYGQVKGAARGGRGVELIRLVADVEVTDLSVSRTLDYVESFVGRLKDLADHEPILYTFPGFIPDWGAELGKLRLWVANYTTAERPKLPRPFDDWVMWQYTDKGSVPGVSGRVDLNRCPRLSAVTLDREEF